MRRRTRRALVGVAAVPVVAVGVLAAEVQLARMGPDLPDDAPLDHDARIGADLEGPALRMTWLGDSTAAGVGATSAARAIPQRVAGALARPVDVTSLAVSGARVADVVDDQLPRLASTRPDVVLVSVGANDVVHLTSRADFRSIYERLVAAADPDAVLVLLGVPDMGAPPRFAQPLRAVAGLRGRQLDGVVREIARGAGAVHVDIAGETGPPMRSDTGRFFAEDRYHPSDDGYALWAAAVVARLEPALQDDRVETPPGRSTARSEVVGAHR